MPESTHSFTITELLVENRRVYGSFSLTTVIFGFKETKNDFAISGVGIFPHPNPLANSGLFVLYHWLSAGCSRDSKCVG